MTRADREALANNALREILEAHYCKEPCTIVEAPPGAGKSGALIRIAKQADRLGERLLIATQSNEQLFSLVESLITRFSDVHPTVFVKASLVEDVIERFGDTVHVTSRAADFVTGPVIVCANVSKWGFLHLPMRFDTIVVDEAFQMKDSTYHLLANLSDSHMFIGDAGQIEPVVKSNIDRFKTLAAGPHHAAPLAVLERHAAVVKKIQMPVSRRLVDDTARFIQPVFYPTLPFQGLTTSAERAVSGPVEGTDWTADALRRAHAGESIVGVALPAKSVSLVDSELITEMRRLVDALLGQTVTYNGRTEIVTPAHIGIVCARTAQVAALQAAMGDLDIFIETNNRFQGLERPIILAWHPASGESDPSAFHLEIGRLCVALSRHLVFCALFMRDGLRETIASCPPSGERILGRTDDGEYRGWSAQLELFDRLERARRVLRVA